MNTRAAAVRAALHEQHFFAPGLFEDDLVRGLTRREACEARLRAELLAEEAGASLEVMAGAVAELRDCAAFAAEIRLESADVVTHWWRMRGDKQAEEPDEGFLAACDMIATVVAGLATATAEMDRRARRELDVTGWQVHSGLRRVRQAQRAERCADRAWQLWQDHLPEWLGDELVWWQVLAAAADAIVADDRVRLAAGDTGVGGVSGGGGGDGDGGGSGGGGDDTPHAGRSHADHGSTHWCDDSGGSEETDGSSSSACWASEGGDDTPLAGETRCCSSWWWMEEKGERWRARGAEGERENVRRDRGEDRIRGGGRSRRGARCYRLRGWRRWLAGRMGPAGRRRMRGAGAAPKTRWSMSQCGPGFGGGWPASAGASGRPPGGRRPSLAAAPGMELELTTLTGVESDVFSPPVPIFSPHVEGEGRGSFYCYVV